MSHLSAVVALGAGTVSFAHIVKVNPVLSPYSLDFKIVSFCPLKWPVFFFNF